MPPLKPKHDPSRPVRRRRGPGPPRSPAPRVSPEALARFDLDAEAARAEVERMEAASDLIIALDRAAHLDLTAGLAERVERGDQAAQARAGRAKGAAEARAALATRRAREDAKLREEAHRLKRRGLSERAIARRLGKPRGRVHRLLR